MTLAIETSPEAPDTDTYYDGGIYEEPHYGEPDEEEADREIDEFFDEQFE